MTDGPTDHIRRLGQALESERPKLQRLDRYYAGEEPSRFLPPEVREASGGRLQALSIPWPRVIVGSIEHRLDVDGFVASPGAPADQDLWRVWQANDLDEASQQAHEEALVHGRSFAIVWAGADGSPLITVESALQVYVEHRPGTRQRLRALKQWVEDGYAFATLYEPKEISRWRSRSRAPQGTDGTVPADGWVLRERLENPLGVVPVVPLTNRGRVLEPLGRSELSPAIPIFDAVNKLATDLMVSAEFHAMPRRWVTGIELQEEPVLDEAGNPTEETKLRNPFDSQAGRTWLAESPETKFGQFTEAQLEGFVRAIELLTQQLASATGVPFHYLHPVQGQMPSAESLQAAEASLIENVRRKQRAFSGPWEEVMRLAVQVRDGHVPVELDRLETVWRDPETRTVAQAADAAVKLVQAGVIPTEQAWALIGFSEAEREAMRRMRRTEALDRAVVDFEELVS